MTDKIHCRVLTGPTGSGKSALALRIARENNWAILCMDSMQVYRGMDIGTAKPTPEEQKQVPHFLLNLCDPRDSFSVSMYREAAESCIIEQHDLGREVLFVGGTGLYLESLLRPMAMGSVPADESLRRELHGLAEGPDGLLLLDRRLREVDSPTADRLPLNDIRRRIRALEVSLVTGIPFSSQEDRPEPSPFRWTAVSLRMDRETLYRRIDQRVQKMMEAGLLREVRNLLDSGVSTDAQSMQAIGYKELVPVMKGEIPLSAAVSEIQKRTRHYAKRQVTFLKRMPEIRYADAEDENVYGNLRKIFMEETES